MKIQHYNISTNPIINNDNTSNIVINVLLSSKNDTYNNLLSKNIEKCLRNKIELNYDKENEYCVNQSFHDLNVNIFINDIHDDVLNDIKQKYIECSPIIHVRLDDMNKHNFNELYFISTYNNKIFSLTYNNYLSDEISNIIKQHNISDIINNESLTATDISNKILTKYNVLKIIQSK